MRSVLRPAGSLRRRSNAWNNMAGRATYGSSRMRWCKPSCGLKKRRRSRLGTCHFRAPSRGHKPVLSEQRLWRSRSAFWQTRWRHMGATAPAPRERWGFHAKDSTESSSAWVFRAGLSPDDKVGAAGTAIPNTKKDPGARLPLRSPPPPLSSGTKTAVAKTRSPVSCERRIYVKTPARSSGFSSEGARHQSEDVET